ncbi:LamG domain-containing protein [Candidatus Nanohalovita haloferacivicina]|nr:LamG domain-containing protein [Candidatus Nanohalobia archaeon BNXNv]
MRCEKLLWLLLALVFVVSLVNGSSYWRFEGNSSVLADFGSTNQNLDFSQPSPYFDGEENFAEVPHNPIYNQTNFSVTFWAYSPYFKDEYTWIGKKDFGTGGPWYFLTATRGVGEDVKVQESDIQFRFTDTSSSVQTFTTTGEPLKAGQWNHLAFSKSSSDLRLFLNGEKVGDWGVSNKMTSSTDPIVIGHEHGGHANWFEGSMDDIRFFNRPLSSSEVAKIYSDKDENTPGLVSHWSGESSGRNLTERVNNSEAYWRTPSTELVYDFESIETSSATDESDNNYDGSVNGRDNGLLKGGAQIEDGYYFQGLNISGEDDYAEINSSEEFSNMTNISFSVWARPSSSDLTNDPYLIRKWTNYGLQIVGGSPTLFINADYDTRDQLTSETPNLESGEWQHIVATYSGVTNTSRMYIDGNLVGSATGSQGKVEDSTEDIGFGMTTYSSQFGDSEFNGSIDQAKIFSQELNQSEVEKLHRMEDVSEDLIGEWTFDNENAGKIYDSSLSSSGISDNALHLDGINDNVTVSTSLTYPEESLTACAWIKPESTSQRPGIITQRDPLILDYQHGNAVFILDEQWSANLNSGNLQTGKWWHLCGTYKESTNNASLYVNGDIVDTQIKDYNLTNAGSTIQIGHRETGDGPQWFKGKIDEVKVESKALSAEGIEDMYLSERSELVQPTGEPNLENIAGERGVLETDTFEFNGVDSYAIDEDLFYPHQGFTVSLWVKNNEKWGKNRKEIWTSGPGEILIRGDNRPGWGKGSAIFHWNDGNEWYAIQSHNLTKGKWHHLTGVYNASSGEYRFYVDGQKQKRSPPSSAPVDNSQRLEDTTMKQYFGRHPSGDNLWNGKIDDLQIYRRPLTTSEVRELTFR